MLATTIPLWQGLAALLIPPLAGAVIIGESIRRELRSRAHLGDDGTPLSAHDKQLRDAARSVRASGWTPQSD